MKGEAGSQKEPRKLKGRSRSLAFIFALFLSPGFAYLYRGEGKKCALFLSALVLFILSICFLPPIALLPVIVLRPLFSLGFLVVYVWLLVDAARPFKKPFEPRWYTHWYSLLGLLVLACLLVEPLSSFLPITYDVVRMPSASLAPTIHTNDYIFVSKVYYKTHQLQRGDVVTFHLPTDPKTRAIKRVIALPGETVEVRKTQVYVNGQPLSEPYARWDEGGMLEGDFPSSVVPSGKVFLLGDNRDHSKDSRFWPEPFLPIENIEGKVLYIYWSWDDPMGRVGTVIR